jgi:phage terminase large subunit-like protein
MTLQQWVEHGWLRVEPSSANEIRDLFSVVMRSLKDAKVEAISDDLRFQAAFSAALNAANIALRASGYRTRVQTGHHQKIVESLELTIQADANVIRKLLLFSKKRNATSYDAAGSVS